MMPLAHADAEKMQRMEAWLEGECYCPCCAQTRECAADCTLASDCPNDAARIDGARQALYGS